MIEPSVKEVDKINLWPTGNKWQMSTLRKGSSGWHIVYGATVAECMEQEFGKTEEEEIDVWA